MKKNSFAVKVPLCFLLCLLYSKALGQPDIIQLYDTIECLKIGKHVWLYEDKSNQLTIDDIIKLGADDFVKSKIDAPNFGVTKSTIWSRIDIIRHSDHEFLLAQLFPVVDTMTFYYPDGLRYVNKKSGWNFPQSHREVEAQDLIFKIPASPIDSLVHYYISVKNRIVILPMSIGTTKSIIQMQHTDSLYYLFYLGMVAMLFLYNLSIYITSRAIEYFYYSTWVLFSILFFMNSKGYSSMLFPEQLSFIMVHANILSSLGGISILLFVQSTLRLKENFPSMTKWYNIMLGAYLIIIVSSLMHRFQLAANLSQLTLMITVFLGLYSGIVIYRQGHSFAKYYLYGFIVTLISMTIYIFIFQKVFPFNVFTSNSIIVGSAIEMILFSFGLGAKINTINKEKLLAQETAFKALKENEQLVYQQNISLESKVEARTRELSLEKQKSDDLLLNILPAEVAHELMEVGISEAKNYTDVSVLFTDFVNFTGISESLTPQALVNELHICFKGIDEIIEKNKLEKIKTIGDAYLAVCGLPNKCDTHAQNTINAAKEICEFILKRKQDGGLFEIRIGIHSGPVIAGIVGIKKFAYDIWGDTVNTAARMEQNSEGGKINISGATYNLIKNNYQTMYRGKIAAKNKGEIDMYFIL